MSGRTISRVALVSLLFVTASCSKPSSPGETQAGAASDANRPPYAGGEHATCSDLPSPEDLKKLMDDAERGSNATLSIDLKAQEIRGPDGGCVKFEIDPFRKHCLLNGLDDIGLTMEKKAAIDTFEKKAEVTRPWL